MSAGSGSTVEVKGVVAKAAMKIQFASKKKVTNHCHCQSRNWYVKMAAQYIVGRRNTVSAKEMTIQRILGNRTIPRGTWLCTNDPEFGDKSLHMAALPAPSTRLLPILAAVS